MANSQNFRSSFNGFNREDVVHYLEYLNNKHNSLINQLTTEADYLRQKLSAAADAITSDSACTERIEALEAQLAESQAARAALEAECADLRAQLAAAQEANAQVQAAPTPSSTVMMELEAYRRAERLERMAQERADQIYHKTNGVLAEASVMVDQVATDISGVADQVVQQLQLLQQTVTGSKKALQDAAAVMYAIRPQTEEN